MKHRPSRKKCIYIRPDVRGKSAREKENKAVHPFARRAFTVFCCAVITASVLLSAAVMIVGISGGESGQTASGQDSRVRSAGAAQADGNGEQSETRAALSEAERTLLCRFICAECEGEPFLCRVAAAAVIFNRMDSEYYPSSLANVIFDAGAFSSVSEGTVALEHSDADMRSALRAVRLAQKGEDPTNGALCLGHTGEDFSGPLPSEITLSAGGMVFGNP